MNAIAEADAYLAARTGRYDWRCARYDAALTVMHTLGLTDEHTVFDVGSGWGEFGARLHTGAISPYGPGPSQPGALPGPSRARYIPVDACNDGTDLDSWVPPRWAEFFVALELLEHLDQPFRLVGEMQEAATRAIIISTPNPDTTDVLGMDATHRTPIYRGPLEAAGFRVREASFYGQPADSLFGVWTP